VLWTTGATITDESIVYLKHDDMDEALLYISCNEWPTVEHVVKVLPSGYEHIHAIDALIKLKNVQSTCTFPFIDVPSFTRALATIETPVREIIQAGCDLMIGMRRFDVNAVCTAGDRLGILGSNTDALPLRSQKLLKKLALFMSEFGRTSLHEWTLPAFFVHEDTSPKNRRWWKKPSSLAFAFQRTTQRFSATLNGVVPPNLKQIHGWVQAFETQANGLHLDPASSRSESDVFRQASAFMTVGADIHQANQNYVLALLSLHRAVEWLLAAKCADEGILDFTSNDGVRMNDPDKKLISFDLLLTALTNRGIMLNGMVGSIATLNSWRNLLAYTHHMSSPSFSDAIDLFTKIRSTLPDIANNEWKQAVSTLSSPWPISIEDILDPYGEIRDSFTLHETINLRDEDLSTKSED
jgi:hypothetical protein